MLDIRDGFGELLPMVHCTTCDSYYPSRQGECRWCGTRPEPRQFAPYVWKGVGGVALVGAAWGVWLASRGTEPLPPAELVNAPKTSVTTVVDSGVAVAPPVQVPVIDTLEPQTPQVIAVDNTAPLEVAGGMPFPPPAESGPVPELGMTTPPRATVAPRVTSRARTSARWTRATARKWITVRASATRKSRIVASIGPDTRVQLGEARGTWMRIRTKGITGWVERGQF
ncbi:MAG TPA: SH3 domain-containing protein [Gemmatimonadaceae bacterium]|nr:SH3 domain-containing protein [Gemmatimonadaceae bacterium]